MTLARALQVAAGNSQESADVAEAIDFDGTNDYLLANSLTGAADSKTFTLSAWVWPSSANEVPIYAAARNNLGTVNFYVYVTNSQELTILAYASGSTTQILNVNLPASAFAKNTFNHLLISFDMASTSNRRIYINDVAVSPTYSVYTNTPLLFSTNTYRNAVATEYIFNTANSKANGRLSNIFLDYTYRDLSITANRRLFITADLKPAAGQAALNPILYLPMSDPTAPGVNAGTGGNFTLTGTIARSGRGPNQYNAPYSTFDGGSDYLSRTTAPTGIANGKQFTWSFVTLSNSASTGHILTISTSTSYRVRVYASGSAVNFEFYNSAGTRILGFEIVSPDFVTGRNNVICMSVDLSDTAKRHIFLNGVAYATTWSPYTNDNINFNVTTTPRYYICAGNVPSLYYNGKLGALWFNTSYIDLSVADNLAKFVTGTGIDAKPVDLGANGELPTGTSPLIYLPMYGNNAGKNYGTGGDFTVNSGPYTGARGPNEFWGNLANFNLATSYLLNSSALGTSTKTLSFVYTFSTQATNARGHFDLSCTASTPGLLMQVDIDATGLSTTLVGDNSSGVRILSATYAWNRAANTLYNVMVCVDMADSSKTKMYINGVDSGWTLGTHTNDFLDLSKPRNIIGNYFNGSSGITGKISEFYFTTDYIDFRQEANRLKFRDAFGNPVNLTQQIEDAAIPNPAIYMRFPPTAFGTNSGTGGDFTVNGTITDGGNL